MKRLKFSLLIGCALLFWSTVTCCLQAQESGSKGVRLESVQNEKYAFLVAAFDYRKGVRPLRFPGNDVDAIKARLMEIGFREENIIVLSSRKKYFDELPTKQNIEESYQRFIDRLQPGDLAFVYLSGHGLQPEDADVAYFAPVDVRVNDIPNTSVSINEMMRKLADSPAKFRWMIVDACRDDPWKDESSRKSFLSSGAKGMTSIGNVPDSISLLQSCQPGECSYEGGVDTDSDVHNGIFTLALLEALSEEGKGDSDGDGAVSFSEIYQYVSKRTNELAKKYHGKEQTPNLSGNITDFAFLEGLTTEEEQLYQEGMKLLDQEDFPAAIGRFKAALQKDPNNPKYERALRQATNEQIQIHIAQGGEYYEEDKISEALNEADAALALDSTNAAATTFKKQLERLIYYVDSNGKQYRLIKAGTFTMGSPLTAEEVVAKYPYIGEVKWYDAPQHEVTLTQDFYLAKAPVTKGEFRRFVEATGYETTAEKEGSAWTLTKEGKWEYVDGKNWMDPGFEQTDDHPVVCVSYDDALAYIDWLNKTGKADAELGGLKPIYRLPTESEWEYACRAGTTTEFFWGDEEKDGEGYLCAAGTEKNPNGKTWSLHFSFDDGYPATAPVGSFKANPWGLYDMLGNVLEWTSDWYGDYPEGEVTDPKGAGEGSFRVMRGGSWDSVPALCRCAYRLGGDPAGRNARSGVRVAFSLTTK